MPVYLFCFLFGSLLGLLAAEFADRWGCSQRYHSSLPKKLLIVLLTGIGAACLYWWEVQCQMLLPFVHPDNTLKHFSLHIILFTFLLAATLTDFYEMVIPDTITAAGSLAALCFAILLPYSALPVTQYEGLTGGFDGPVFEPANFPMHVWSPIQVHLFTLPTMVFLWWFWCFAMLDRVWYIKLPFRKAHALFWRYLYRSPRTKYIIAAAILVPLCFAFVPDSWERAALQSALTGMVTGMILIWAVRLVSQYILGIEAMGFGDVTLMGMIGAFLGWQPVLLIFFIAPFFGLIFGIINVILGKGRAVPYGPFLCLATVVVIIFWCPIWQATQEYFAYGIGVTGLCLFMLLFLFAGLLYIVHKIMSGFR